MLQKKYRLKEREVQKVLRKWKPFFTATVVSNTLKNKLGHNRFAIVIGGKSVKNAVERNYFRRLFYDTVSPFILKWECDSVFVVKTKTKLQLWEKKIHESFKNDILLCVKKLFS